MAETLESHNFRAGHGNMIYPWHEWIDGSVKRITKGTDFTVTPDVMRGQVIVRARKEGRRVATNVRGDSVTFCFQRKNESDSAFEKRVSPNTTVT